MAFPSLSPSRLDSRDCSAGKSPWLRSALFDLHAVRARVKRCKIRQIVANERTPGAAAKVHWFAGIDRSTPSRPGRNAEGKATKDRRRPQWPPMSLVAARTLGNQLSVCFSETDSGEHGACPLRRISTVLALFTGGR